MKKGAIYLSIFGSIFFVILIALVSATISNEQISNKLHDAGSLNYFLESSLINQELLDLGLHIWFQDVNFGKDDKISDFTFGYIDENNAGYRRCEATDEYDEFFEVENTSGTFLIFENEGSFSGVVSSEINENQSPEEFYSIIGVFDSEFMKDRYEQEKYFYPYIEEGSPWEVYKNMTPQNRKTARALFSTIFLR
jgi:hypothetical protein